MPRKPSSRSHKKRAAKAPLSVPPTSLEGAGSDLLEALFPQEGRQEQPPAPPPAPLDARDAGPAYDGSGPNFCTTSELGLVYSQLKKGRYPLSQADRANIIENCFRTMQLGQVRSKLMAIKILATLDKLNMEQEKVDSGGDHLNIHVDGEAGMSLEELKKLPPDELVRLHRASLGLSAVSEDDQPAAT